MSKSRTVPVVIVNADPPSLWLLGTALLLLALAFAFRRPRWGLILSVLAALHFYSAVLFLGWSLEGYGFGRWRGAFPFLLGLATMLGFGGWLALSAWRHFLPADRTRRESNGMGRELDGEE